jgi:hypothetical protein
MNKINIEKIIQKHTDSIVKGIYKMPNECCRNCNNESVEYKLHECGKRQFRIIVKDIVKVMMSFLLRWKCPHCKSTFLDYPFFAMPYKRFTIVDISALSKQYIETENLSYRKSVMDRDINIGYPDPATRLCNHFLAHSTVWRFNNFMADFIMSFKKSSFYTKKIHPTKYRTQSRKALLLRALHTIVKIYSSDITWQDNGFQDFETPCT